MRVKTAVLLVLLVALVIAVGCTALPAPSRQAAKPVQAKPLAVSPEEPKPVVEATMPAPPTTARECSVDEDCADSIACTYDFCEQGSATAECRHLNIGVCVGNDECCPAGCTHAEDRDCPETQTPPAPAPLPTTASVPGQPTVAGVPVAPAEGELFACGRDADCTLTVNGACDGALSVNKAWLSYWHEQAVKQWVAAGARACNEAQYTQGFQPYCYQGKCAKRTVLKPKNASTSVSSTSSTPPTQQTQADPYALTTGTSQEFAIDEKYAVFWGTGPYAGKKLQLLLKNLVRGPDGGLAYAVFNVVDVASGRTLSVKDPNSGSIGTSFFVHNVSGYYFAPLDAQNSPFMAKEFSLLGEGSTSNVVRVAWR